MSEVKIPEGFKQTEVGIIPKDWEVEPLKSLLKEPPKYGINAAAVPLTGNLPVYIRITDISEDGYYSPEKVVGVNNPFSSSYILNEGDIVLARTGASVGKSYLYRKEDGTLIYAGFLIKVSPNEKQLNPKYLHQYLKTEQYWDWVIVNSMRSGQPGINGNEYGRLLIPLPSIEEQTAIATALSDVDELIQSLEKLIAKKEVIKTGTMQQLLTGKTRLPEFATHDDGSPKGFKQTELGRIPEDWDLVELRDLLSYEQPTKYIINGNEFLEDGTTPILTAGKSFILGYTEETHGIYRNLPTIIFDDFTTATQFVNFPFKVKSSAMKILKPKSTSVPIQLIYLLLSNIDYKVGDHKRHWISEFSSLKVRLPNSSIEQTAIATVLSDMDTEIQVLQQRLEKTKDIKQGMMQQLLTGKLRLAH
ncbi:MAG: restriction endonuclease subunit S [Psychrobacter sp.]|nr:restriction endonuclease subunit S [Psychrobacter sp.]